MPANLYNFFDRATLEKHIEEGFVNKQAHPTLPLAILNYTHKAQIERRWNDTTKRARGFIYNTLTNEVVSRPFSKFFNLGEEGAPTLEKLAEAKEGGEKLRIREKLDGSLGIFYRVPHGGRVHYGVATRGSFTSPQALFATKFINDLIAKNGGNTWATGTTPLVEIIYPENRIVVDYGKFAGLVLLTITDSLSSDYELSPMECRRWATNFGIPIAVSYAAKDFTKLAEETRTNFEGYVVEYNSARGVQRVKVKLKEYVQLHKVITGWNAKSVWELLKEGRSYEDLFDSNLPEHFRKWFNAAVTALTERYNAVEKEAKSQYVFHKECALKANENRRMLRKYYAEEFSKNEKYKAIFFNMLDNKKYSDIIWDMVRPKATETFILDADVAAEGATA